MPFKPSGRALLFSVPFRHLLVISLLSTCLFCAADTPLKARVGTAVVVLTGPWKFHAGDDSRWANPDFDDSGWSTMDLTPPQGSYDPITGSSGFVPGWTSHGHPNLTGYAWYRLHLQLQNEDSSVQASSLALTMPLNFDDAYQIFINGQKVGEFGRFTGSHVTFYNSQPQSFALPAGIRGGPVTIAIRFWMDAVTPLQSPDAGGMHGPPLLGQASAIDAMLRLEWDSVNRTQVGNLLSATFLLLAALLGLTLFWFDRREPAYLWLGLACLLSFAERAIVMTGYYSLAVAMDPENFFIDVLSRPISLGLWALFWIYWFALDDIRRIKRAVWILTAALVLGMAMLRPPLFGSLIPPQASSVLLPLTLILKLLLGALLLWITYRGIRKRAGDGWMALAPILLMIFWEYQEELGVVHVPTIMRIFGLTITVGIFATLLMLAIISVLLMRRFVRGQRERELWRLEIEQARQVQQVLIPEALPTVPGFRLASEYRPAQQVGGDFFQILPIRNGAVLAVIGDVSGKGMPAAMTVSLLVGTVRTLAHFTNDPGEILTAMNVRMMARSHGGFTTCLVLRASPDGLVTAANAGHLSPYLEGKEVLIESGLPLGLSAESKYVESTFRLGENQQLTLVSDGVVEARGHAGELFGFERTGAIATKPAQAIADAAQTFGQDDDITVLTVTRVTTNAATTVATPTLSLVQ
ncbi:MAG TPA: SpoIIE family protein phosphatase [Terracidiphilus sp.]|nr:SpoIIE family protein phosphatase [Terracidiphilus sp.]